MFTAKVFWSLGRISAIQLNSRNSFNSRVSKKF